MISSMPSASEYKVVSQGALVKWAIGVCQLTDNCCCCWFWCGSIRHFDMSRTNTCMSREWTTQRRLLNWRSSVLRYSVSVRSRDAAGLYLSASFLSTSWRFRVFSWLLLRITPPVSWPLWFTPLLTPLLPFIWPTLTDDGSFDVFGTCVLALISLFKEKIGF